MKEYAVNPNNNNNNNGNDMMIIIIKNAFPYNVLMCHSSKGFYTLSHLTHPLGKIS